MHRVARSDFRPWSTWVVIAVAPIAAIAMFGLPRPWNLVPFGLAGLGTLAALAWRRPDLLVASVPAWLPPPQFAKLFAYEVILLGVAGVMVLAALRTRRPWLTRLEPFELAVLGLFGWAIATGAWIRDPWWYLFGLRKMGIGVLALWTSWRLARVLPSRTMLAGITVGALALATWTLGIALRNGLALAPQAIGTLGFSRTESTNLGWGTSNFIGAILVLMLPTALLVGMHGEKPSHRWLGWLVLPLGALVMAVSASRGGSILMLLIALYVVLRERAGRRTLVILAMTMLSFGLLVAGPLGQRLLSRFTDARELGSMVIRLFYFREAGRRVLDNLPLGIGWGQGYGYPDHLNTVDPHNYLLVIGSELGIPGLLLWGLVLLMLWRLASRIMRNPSTAAAGRALQLTLVISQVNSLFEPTFQGLQYHFMFYWIVGAYLGAFGNSPATDLRVPELARGEELLPPASTI